jgi:hypothetical protein
VNTTPSVKDPHSWKNNSHGATKAHVTQRGLCQFFAGEVREGRERFLFLKWMALLPLIKFCVLVAISQSVVFPRSLCLTDCILTDWQMHTLNAGASAIDAQPF